MSDISQQIKEQIEAAIANKTPLNIIGGNSKSFLGHAIDCQNLKMAEHSGIINYEPSELVMTARAGTSLEEIETALNQHNQMLPFEPPHYGSGATIGGTIACNLSGPRRAYAGAARDYVLGTKIINGKAEELKFGGEVMKNVAGYDVSRLMVGAMGTLGVMLEISFKVLPCLPAEITLVQAMSADDALRKMNQWAASPLPMSATCYINGKLYVRLSGVDSALQAARNQIGGEELNDSKSFWFQLREHGLPLFKKAEKLWRLSVPQTTSPLSLDGEQIIEWGGGLRWLFSDSSEEEIRNITKSVGGHATLYKGESPTKNVFQSLDAGINKLHHNLKHAFDPAGIFNPGRMFNNL